MDSCNLKPLVMSARTRLVLCLNAQCNSPVLARAYKTYLNHGKLSKLNFVIYVFKPFAYCVGERAHKSPDD